MREYTLVFQKGLGKGLRNSKRTPRNTEVLVQSIGCFPEDLVARAISDLTASWLDTSSLTVAFPYPQIFSLTQTVLVCTATTIYEYSAGSFLLAITSLPEGSTWTVADYGRYLILTNGACLVTRDGITGEWDKYVGCAIPPCLCLCDINGQLLVGAPGITVSAGFKAQEKPWVTGQQ